jgi:hypothetical protein
MGENLADVGRKVAVEEFNWMRKRRLRKGEKDGLAGAALGGMALGAALGGPPGAILGGAVGLLIADSVNTEKKKSRKKTVKRRNRMANKVIFIAFAVEDKTQRNFLVGQSLHTDTPFGFTDVAVKEPYDSGWKEKVRTRIRRSDGVIALISKNSSKSTGQTWEISCAEEEEKPILAIWGYSDDRSVLSGVKTVAWTWDGIAKFIDGL